MDISVHRNYFGRQIASFEQVINLSFPKSANTNSSSSPSSTHFPGVFIRAPAILGVKEEAGVKVIGEIEVPNTGKGEEEKKGGKVIVAVQQGSRLATVFHPELTSPLDKRVHEYFVELVREYKWNGK
jgi:pyridoxal 5'-phosphate synthase pdxT subunit